jgi:hypothetical protein
LKALAPSGEKGIFCSAVKSTVVPLNAANTIHFFLCCLAPAVQVTDTQTSNHHFINAVLFQIGSRSSCAAE